MHYLALHNIVFRKKEEETKLLPNVEHRYMQRKNEPNSKTNSFFMRGVKDEMWQDNTYLKAKAKTRRNIGDADLHCKIEGNLKDQREGKLLGIEEGTQRMECYKRNPYCTSIMFKYKRRTIVANVTEIKTSDALLKLISSAVARAVGKTVKGKGHL